MYQYKARLVRVVDADTLELEIDLGFHIRQEIRVRLLGIDCPERFTEEGKSATQFVKNWFTPEEFVIVTTVKDKQEKYGRYLAFVEGTNGDLATALKEAGFIK